MNRNRNTALIGLALGIGFLAGCSAGDPEVASLEETPQVATAPSTRPMTPGAAGERVTFTGLSYEVPGRWVPQAPSSGMRQAQYVVPRAEGDVQDGECALFVFPGTGGSVDANLQRWYGQMVQPDGSSTADRARVESFEAGGLAVTLVDVTGTYSGGMSGSAPVEGHRLVAGIVETATDPWFLKCTGPEATMETATAEMLVLLQSVQP